MSRTWNEGDRVVVSSMALPDCQNPYKEKPRDLIGHITQVTFRVNGNSGNEYIVKLDNPVHYHGGFLEVIALYTAHHLRKRY